MAKTEGIMGTGTGPKPCPVGLVPVCLLVAEQWMDCAKCVQESPTSL